MAAPQQPQQWLQAKAKELLEEEKANVEMVFSRAGNLSDPNMDPEFLAHLVMVLINKKSYKPSIDAIKDKYFELFRGKGGEGQEADEGGASPSGSK